MIFTNRLVRGTFIIVAIMLSGIPSKTLAQDITELDVVSVKDQEITLSGWLTALWMDSEPGSGVGEQVVYYLSEPSGASVQLEFDTAMLPPEGELFGLDRKYVTVEGISPAPLNASDQPKTIIVKAIEPDTAAGNNNGSVTLSSVSGSQPWITILCKFADISAEPKPPSYFSEMFANTFPGLDHYWREQSYNLINLTGSSVSGWFTLPHPKPYYYSDTNGDGNPELNTDRAFDDCTDVSNSSIDFSKYLGINLMLNDDMNYAVGGGKYTSLDGVSKIWYVTWEPPWAYSNLAVIAHEMGHGFGLPHSSGHYGETYDNQWDVMSDTWTNCGLVSDPEFGCLGQHTIAYHKSLLNWLKGPEILVLAPGKKTAVTLERLAQPASDYPKMIKIPIGGSESHFYTVEVRRYTGYDEKIPGEAVVIHEVDTTRIAPAHVVDRDNNGNTGDSGAIWLPGETFFDLANDIQVTINVATATGYQATVSEVNAEFVFLPGILLGSP